MAEVPGYRLRSSNLRDGANEDGAVRAAAADRLSEKASSFGEARGSSHGGRKGSRSSTAGSKRHDAGSVSRAVSKRNGGSPARNVDDESDVVSLSHTLNSLGKQVSRRRGDKARSTAAGSERRSRASLKAQSLPAGEMPAREVREDGSVGSSRASDVLRTVLEAKKEEIDAQLDIEEREIELRAQLEAEKDRLAAEEQALAMEEKRLKLQREREALSKKQAAKEAEIALARRRADAASTYKKALRDLAASAEEESFRSDRSSVSSQSRSRRTEDWVRGHAGERPSPSVTDGGEGERGVTAAVKSREKEETSSPGRRGSDSNVRAAAPSNRADERFTEGDAAPMTRDSGPRHSPIAGIGSSERGVESRWSTRITDGDGHLMHPVMDSGGRSPSPEKSRVRGDSATEMTGPDRGALPFVSGAETSPRLHVSEGLATGVLGTAPSDTAAAGSGGIEPPFRGLGAGMLTLRSADGSVMHVVPVTHPGGLNSSKSRGEPGVSVSSPVGLRSRSPTITPKPFAVRSLEALGGGSRTAEVETKNVPRSVAAFSSVVAEASAGELQHRRESATIDVDRQSCSVAGACVKPPRDMDRWPYLRATQSECSPSRCVKGCGQQGRQNDPFVDKPTDLPCGTSANNLAVSAQVQQAPLPVTVAPVTSQVRPPAYEMERFGGDPTCYHLFVRNFTRMVHRACSDDAERLARLAHLCTGRARDIVRAYEQWADASEGYRLALMELEEEFGQKDDVVVAWRAKLFTGKHKDPDSLCRQLKICYSALRQLGHVNEMSSEYHLAALVRRLPGELQREWVRLTAERARRREEVGLLQLVHLLEDAAARQKREKRLNNMSDGGPTDRSRASASCHAGEGGRSRPKGPGAGRTKGKGKADNDETDGKCPYCHADHLLSSCRKFESLEEKKRSAVAREIGLCYCCLKTGHRYWRCKERKLCGVDGCTKTHHPLLHRGTDE